jgi:hypothetical protein
MGDGRHPEYDRHAVRRHHCRNGRQAARRVQRSHRRRGTGRIMACSLGLGRHGNGPCVGDRDVAAGASPTTCSCRDVPTAPTNGRGQRPPVHQRRPAVPWGSQHPRATAMSPESRGEMGGEVESPVRYGSVTAQSLAAAQLPEPATPTPPAKPRTCRVCARQVTSTRATFCSPACKQIAFRRRNLPTTATTGPVPAAMPNVYECPGCGGHLTQQRCPECHLFCTRLGPGGCCPECDAVILVTELLGVSLEQLALVVATHHQPQRARRSKVNPETREDENR